MRCPACERLLTKIDIGRIAVDACEGGCGGIWFDWFEIQKVDETHEALGEKLLEMDRDASVAVDHDARRSCPRCSDMIMMRHFWSVKREVEVDECPECGGMWLDSGELARIRSQFASESERREAAEKLFGDMVAEELGEMRSRRHKAEGISRLFAILLKD